MEKARQAIEAIDLNILKLLENRMDQVRQIGQYKKENNMPVNDLSREEKLLEGLKNRVHNQAYWDTVEKVYQTIFTTSKALQTDIQEINTQDTQQEVSEEFQGDLLAKFQENTVAYFGALGSYTHEAKTAYFPQTEEGQCIGFSSFEQVVAAVVEGTCQFGILPIENSSTGSIYTVYDLIGKMPIEIVGEIKRPIAHYLMAKEKTNLGKLEVVYSHHQALSQCQSYLYEKGWHQRAVDSSSDGARLASQNPNTAAIGSLGAAALYGLEIFEGPINDFGLNQTRFIIFKREGAEAKTFEATTPRVIGLSFRLKHQSGTLAEVLTVFSKRQLNLLKIESRPIGDKPFEYQFYMDFETRATQSELEGDLPAVQSNQDGAAPTPNSPVEEALQELAEKTTWLKILGSWEKA